MLRQTTRLHYTPQHVQQHCSDSSRPERYCKLLLYIWSLCVPSHVPSIAAEHNNADYHNPDMKSNCIYSLLSPFKAVNAKWTPAGEWLLSPPSNANLSSGLTCLNNLSCRQRCLARSIKNSFGLTWPADRRFPSSSQEKEQETNFIYSLKSSETRSPSFLWRLNRRLQVC